MPSLPIIGNSRVFETDVDRLLAVDGVNPQLARVFAATVVAGNELLREVATDRQATDEEKQRIIAVVLLARVLEAVESIYLLASHGMRQECITLFRVFLDAYFILGNVCSDPGFLKIYFTSDEAERLKLMRAGAKRAHPLFNAMKSFVTPEIQAQLAEKIRDEKIDNFNSYLYAQKIGCENIYDSIYRLSSGSVHTSPRSLETYIHVDDEGEIKAVVVEPDATCTNRVLYDTHTFLCKCLCGICELFGKESSVVRQLDQRREEAERGEL